jgi:hypothetical protein
MRYKISVFYLNKLIKDLTWKIFKILAVTTFAVVVFRCSKDDDNDTPDPLNPTKRIINGQNMARRRNLPESIRNQNTLPKRWRKYIRSKYGNAEN